MTTYEILDHIEKTDNTEQLHDIASYAISRLAKLARDKE
jgi:hypothetical protein|tara:strand:+ start:104 stop:220 length:117 start_codon:yes stop_codon:yes gene_type:complete